MPILPHEHRLLRDTARKWSEEKSPLKALRGVRDGKADLGFDPVMWSEIARMGWTGAAIPQDHGGSALGFVALGSILEEIGRTLTASPLAASVMAAAPAIAIGGTTAQRRRWLPGIADGSVVATLAIDEGPRHAPEWTALAATRSAKGLVLNGRKTMVPEGMAADLIVVAARTHGAPGDTAGIELFLVPATSPGITRTRLTTIDGRGFAHIDFHDVAVDDRARLDGGFALLEKVLDHARIGIAAEMLGAAGNAFDITLDYLKTRVQFGQVIGAFQALQHRAALMFIELELTRSAVQVALAALDADSADLPVLASIAKTRAGDTLHLVTNEMVQLHGGFGMTDDCDAGLFIKRARVCAAAYGNQAYHRERYAVLHGY